MRFNLKKTLAFVAAGLMLPLFALAQSVRVSGTVTDQSGAPVPGAAVMVVDSSNGAVTGVDGTYSLQAGSSAILEVSCMGYTTIRVPVQGRSRVDVVLEEDAEQLEATVVVGYGTARRTDVTGSIASVTGESLREIPANDITYALQGRIAGVEFAQSSSRPGESMRIRIRGERSLNASNDPLIVLDGIPFSGSLSDISTNDIKSIDVLKDAASTAIYGSRGANGVIMITTHKGVKGQEPRVSFNSYVALKQAIKYPLMRTEKYLQMREMAGKYQNSLDEDPNVDTDWQDLFYRPGYTQNYEVSVSGGNQKGSYSFGTSYYDDQAVVPTQNYDRIGLRAAIDQQIGKWVKVGFSTNTNYNKNRGTQTDIYNVLSKTPMINPYDEAGNLRAIVKMPMDNQYVATRERIEEWTAAGKYVGERKALATYNTGYVELTQPWIEGLSYKVNLGLNYRDSESGSFTGSGIATDTPTSLNGASWSHSKTVSWNIQNLLTYDRVFAGKHRVNLTGLMEADNNVYTTQAVSGNDIPNEDFQYYNLGYAQQNLTVSPNNWRRTEASLLSYMGRLMYSYDDRYMLTVAVRSDASSRLAKGHQWHTYPAVSVGWNLHKESFMQGASGWLDELKFRLGYGETSNQAISPYQTLGSLGTKVYNYGDDNYATGYYVTTLPNPELGWEYSQTWNFGIDFAFFKGRLRGTAEYYSVATKDVLLSLSLPSTSGVGSVMSNVGATANKGIEFTVNGTIIQQGDWNWTAGLNIYHNRSKLVALASGQKENTGAGWFVGYPINCLYDYEYDGIWQEADKDIIQLYEKGAAPGDIRVKYHGEYNADGTPVRSINDNDRVPIVCDPLFQGGFNTTLTWKNLDLTVLGAFQAGGILRSGIHGTNGYLNLLTGRRGQLDVDFWTPENTGARYPKPGGLLSGDNPKYLDVAARYDASYFKIRTITLGYNLHKIAAVRRAGINRLRVYATVQNPGIVLFSEFHKESGLDPEVNTRGGTGLATGSAGARGMVGFNTPATHNYLLGINLTF